ncbi:hypothetical protein SAMD00023353_0900440 [Rosellinia necatrix]|uniref:Uncharacterized protein n=1 Tax=Rosellinia necatrix TaxID=77044 RepID=A0A1S8A6E4_ROSNE|nr:hypothetical protein SAMD00023353_0900440 [Rosellinia necatrix]
MVEQALRPSYSPSLTPKRPETMLERFGDTPLSPILPSPFLVPRPSSESFTRKRDESSRRKPSSALSTESLSTDSEHRPAMAGPVTSHMLELV